MFLLIVYTVSFGVILKARWGFSGRPVDYVLILFAGLIVFNAFSEVLTKSATIIVSNPNFVKKVVFPLELLPVITVSIALIHMLISIGIWTLGYLVILGMPNKTLLVFPLVLICFTPLLLGLGWQLSAIGVFIKDINQATGLINHCILFLSPIFYSIEAAPLGIQRILAFNPLTFIVEQLRLVLFYGELPALRGLSIYFMLSVVFAYFSFKLFMRLKTNFADQI